MDRRRLTHDEAVLDLPALVIGVLDDDEAEAVSSHVAECTRCQEEQTRLEQSIALIGTTAPAIEPPRELRSRVLGLLNESVAEPAPVSPPSLIPRLLSFGLAAAAVLVIGFFGWALVLRHDLNQTQANLNQALRQRTTDVEILAKVSHVIPMVADSSPDAYGTMYVAAQSNQALLVMDELPPTPSGKTYQVWLVNGSTRITAGVFTVGQSGGATVMITAPKSLMSYQSLGITTEPGPSGSPSPTGPRIIGCALR